MEHKEYIRIVPGSKHAVLMIHGIVGTPKHFEPFLPLIPEDWTVYNLLLDGHGKGVKEFAQTSMKKWKSQVAARVREILDTHDTLVIAAHSMGGLFHSASGAGQGAVSAGHPPAALSETCHGAGFC